MGSPNISFEGIPSNIRKPGIYSEFNLAMAKVGLPATDDRIILIAGRTVSGAAPALAAYKAFSDADVLLNSGAGSLAHMTARAMFEANPYINLTVIGVDDGAGIAAAGALTVTGPATGGGIITVRIGNEKIVSEYEAGQEPAVIAASLKTVIDSKAHLLPATVTIEGAVITPTARNKGLTGNHIRMEAMTSGGGVGVTVAPMAGGTGAPELDALGGVLEKLYSGTYTVYVSVFNDVDNLTALRNHITEISAGREMRPAIGVFGYTDLVGTGADLYILRTALNGWRLSCGYLPGSRSCPWEIAGAYAAGIVSDDHPNANWDDVVLRGVHAPEEAYRLGGIEQEDLLNNGVTPLHVIPGEQVAIVRAITTYVHNEAGIKDPVLLDLAKPRALDYLRYACRATVGKKYKRKRKTDNRKRALIADIEAILYLLEGREVVKNTDHWKDYILIEDDLDDDTRWNVRIPGAIVPGLHIIAQRIDLL